MLRQIYTLLHLQRKSEKRHFLSRKNWSWSNRSESWGSAGGVAIQRPPRRLDRSRSRAGIPATRSSPASNCHRVDSRPPWRWLVLQLHQRQWVAGWVAHERWFQRGCWMNRGTGACWPGWTARCNWGTSGGCLLTLSFPLWLLTNLVQSIEDVTWADLIWSLYLPLFWEMRWISHIFSNNISLLSVAQESAFVIVKDTWNKRF